MNAAVIGLGGMGRRHVTALQQLGATLIAVCDLRAGVLEDFPGTVQRYFKWQELIEREKNKLDLVCVATNGPCHAEIVSGAAKAGVKYILCEKPMATSGKLARDMLWVCEEKGALLAVNLCRRFAQRYIKLKKLLQSGVIGDVRHISVIVGAGGLACIGTHFFDLIEWLTGAKAVWVIGEVESNPLPNVRGEQFFDPGGRGMIRYNTGMNVAAEFSEDVPVLTHMHFRGQHGHFDVNEWSGPKGGSIDIWTRPEDRRNEAKTHFVHPVKIDFEIEFPLDVVDATRRCMEDLLNGRVERTDLGGIVALDTLLAFHLSEKRGLKKVELPLQGVDLLFDVPIT